MTSTTTPAPTTIRLTIPVSSEVHDAFSRMAKASGMSIGRCMGEWLADTVEGVEFITEKMERAREAPRMVVREMRQNLLGVVDEMDAVMSQLRAGSAARGAAATRDADPPRSVIRGGKSTKTRRNPGV